MPDLTNTVAALRDITFSVPKGKVFGLLGTNGAGKSTLLRSIAGILECDSGEISVDGEVCQDHPGVKEKFFYLPDDPYYFSGARDILAVFMRGRKCVVSWQRMDYNRSEETLLKEYIGARIGEKNGWTYIENYA